MKKIELQSNFLNKIINVSVLIVQGEIQILISGGDKEHIGSVCIIDSNGNSINHCFSGHRDNIIAQKWVLEIYKKTQRTVVVSAGIHYENITSKDIEQIINITDDLLKKILSLI